MRKYVSHCVWLSVLLHFSATWGCSSATNRGVDARREAYTANDEANTAFQAKQYDVAEAKYSAAIDAGGLNFDVLCDAHIKRAVCRAATGRIPAALAELQEVQDHGGDLAKIESARSYIFRKQRNEPAARAAAVRARRLNPVVEFFQD